MAEYPMIGASTDEVPDYFAQQRARARLEADLRPANKTALFNALGAAGVSLVTVAFDGSGDSGQIESIEPFAGDAATELPTAAIEIAEPLSDGSDIERKAMSVRDAIEHLAYDFLEETHGGWEDNEGAYGEFTFDVAERKITLGYNERFIETEYSEHEF